MSCDNCLTSGNGISRHLETIKTEAKKYAVQNQITVAVYKEGQEYRFIEAREAIKSGLPILEYISKHI